MVECTCEYHLRENRWKEALSKYDLPNEVIKIINEIQERLAYTEEDKEYYELILNGSWSSSVDILERSLAIAKKKKERFK